MKKKVFKISIIVFLFGFFGTMGFLIVRQLMIKKEAAEKIQDVPAFKFYTLANTGFTNDSIANGKPVIIIHFSPDCENCQDEARELQQKLPGLGDVQVLMIADGKKEPVEKFMIDYRLNVFPQIKPLLDNDGVFFKAFGVALNPLVIIYNNEHRFVKMYKGQTKVEAIRKALNNEKDTAKN
jgi:peroxiredoxin